MHSSSVRVRLDERPTLNSYALSHWFPPAANGINPTLLACLYALSIVIKGATLPALFWLFTYLSPGQDVSVVGVNLLTFMFSARRISYSNQIYKFKSA